VRTAYTLDEIVEESAEEKRHERAGKIKTLQSVRSAKIANWTNLVSIVISVVKLAPPQCCLQESMHDVAQKIGLTQDQNLNGTKSKHNTFLVSLWGLIEMCGRSSFCKMSLA
jgi:hypothetical protein